MMATPGREWDPVAPLRDGVWGSDYALSPANSALAREHGAPRIGNSLLGAVSLLLVEADAPHPLEIVARVALEGHQRGGLGDPTQAGQLARNDLSHLIVVADAHDRHQVVLAGYRVDFLDLGHLEERFGDLLELQALGAYQHDGGDHEQPTSGRDCTIASASTGPGACVTVARDRRLRTEDEGARRVSRKLPERDPGSALEQAYSQASDEL